MAAQDLPRPVFIVEDDLATRERLARAVAREADLRVLGSAGTLAEARAALAGLAPAVLLVDLGLPDGSGIELIRALSRSHPQTQCMVISVFGDEAHVVAAIEAGASGYLLKDALPDEIGHTIRDLLAGGSPISAAVARRVLQRLRAPAPRSITSPSRPSLSERETEVLDLVSRGYAYREIGDALSISIHAVGFHIRQIYRKLAVASRGEAAFQALEGGMPGERRSPDSRH